jgi:hypothetical protein
MILAFSTQMNGKPTFFVEKILTGLLNDYFETDNDKYIGISEFTSKVDLREVRKPKLHTIREDKNDRWKPGTNIDFFINCRQPNMFRFAPVLPMVSTQEIEIRWIGLSKEMGEMRPWVRIDGKSIYTIDQIDKDKMLQLANNDGFDTIEDFFAYFNQDFTGKLIHWTELKY